MLLSISDLVTGASRICKSPILNRLVLQSSFQFSVEAFKEAIKYWKRLQSLILPYVFRYEEILSSIGENCKNFAEIKSSCSIDLGFAEAIVANVPGLKVLSLRHTAAFKEALLHLLKSLKNLEVLNLTHVLVADLTQAGLELQGIDEKITNCTLHLKMFFTSGERRCPKCNIVEDGNIWRSYELDEEDWPQDEVASHTI
ncbi:hypothetical protein TIFTF001_052513 [Ficus carica]|uniref:F-box/LRR-repeat protein n=1 Tax=Ficus carica TaxID=3494 RepID=A0AA88JJD5_FICCA|nr:hypothetical protein TIFTF001_052513 [Ficus carica]